MAKKVTDTTAITIFFDIDGVLGDFDNHAAATAKMKPDFKNPGKMMPDYDAMDEQWWETMPAYDGARDMVIAARRMAPNVRFLTGPIPSPSCYSGKAKWLLNFEPELQGRYKTLPNLIICPAPDKALLATPKRILIDDSLDNVANWRAAGGIAIHHDGKNGADWRQTMAALSRAVAILNAHHGRGGPAPSL